MTELELKYGCNPNQKPARIFMKGDMIICPYGNAAYRFELTVKPEEKDYLERNPILKEHADVVEKILKGAE